MAEETSPPAEPDPLLGRVLSGHYRLDARLGGGAMGTVYRARHTLLEQDFAVKVLARELVGDPDVRRRFLVEARSLALFVHRNAVQVRGCGEDAGVLYLAMDLCPGVTLADLLAKEGRLPRERAVGIAVQILAALDEAHRAGIVHRDLKPGNVIVETTRGADGRPVDVVRVVDFGLARIVGAGHAALPDAFASLGGNVVGTVAYMSPEQLRAADDVDGRSDLFAVGVVLHEMLAGSSPFPGTSTMSIAMKIVDATPAPWPEAVAHDVGVALNAVISRALAKDRADRYATAGEFAAALREALADPAGPPPPPPVVRAPRSIPVADAGPAADPSARAPFRRRGVRFGIVLVLAVFGVIAYFVVIAGDGNRSLDDRDRRIDVARGEGAQAFAEGRYADAVDAYSDVIGLAPRDGEAFLARARARTELSDRNAPADLDEADRLLKDDPRVATVRGRFAWRVGKDGAAADQAFLRALTFDEANVEARFERAVSEVERGLSALAEQDATAIERRSPGDARVPWIRAELRLRAANAIARDPAAGALADEAVAAAKEAIAKDPRWADAARLLASALCVRAYGAKTRGDYDGARKALEEAIEASTRALDLATGDPGYRGQGATRAKRFYERAGIRFLQLDDAAALADLSAALSLEPKNPDVLSMRAYALQQSGDHEGAIRDFERLYDVSHDADHLFRQAFGWQRIGDGRADVGDRDGAVAAYGKAIELYGAGPADGANRSGFPAYRGETRVRRARWLEGAAREAEWNAADADFAEALRRKTADAETLLRRAELSLARRDAARAYDDAKAAIGDRKDQTPRYYARFAKAAMMRAREEAAAGRAGPAQTFAAEAVENALRARDVAPELSDDVAPLVAEAYVCAAAVAPDAKASDEARASAEGVLAKLLEKRGGGAGIEAVVARASAAYVRAGAALVAHDAALALRLAREAVDLRAAEAAAHRWYEDSLFVERLADALEATGDAAGAKAARERASRLPR